MSYQLGRLVKNSEGLIPVFRVPSCVDRIAMGGTLRPTGIPVLSRGFPPMNALSRRSGVFWASERPRRPDAPGDRNQISRFIHPSLGWPEISNHPSVMPIGRRAAQLEVMQQASPEQKDSRPLADRNDDLAFTEITFGNGLERVPRDVPRIRLQPRGRP
jgi:hypothetical protein